MNRTYRIEARDTTLGEFEASSPIEAIAAMFKNAGYASIADVAKAYGDTEAGVIVGLYVYELELDARGYTHPKLVSVDGKAGVQ